MHIHILGIAGTFMGGIASLAIQKGYRVTGSDEHIYPPMSTQLESLGIEWYEGYSEKHLQPHPDIVVVGNVIKRGNPAIEYVLNEGLRYQSGPQWLAENILQDRWVIGVAGTHGKTTTSSMIAWVLHYAQMEPGYLIGGIPSNFGLSAQLGRSPYFVVEADEYDCAFFDKRSKFVHYQPRTCVLNNLEFDHADIFSDLAQIQKQFHHLIRVVPGKGAVIYPSDDSALQQVIYEGVWSEQITLGPHGQWQAKLVEADGSVFTISHQGKQQGTVTWGLLGQHNVYNALAAVAACAHAGIPANVSIEALASFQSVKRRLEVRGEVKGITVYDDFAHHPTAIRLTLEGLKSKIGHNRLIAVLDLRSNTMRMGTHQATLAQALLNADLAFIYQSPQVTWPVTQALASLGDKAHVYQDTQSVIQSIVSKAKAGDHILIMSNGGFDGIHERLLAEFSA